MQAYDSQMDLLSSAVFYTFRGLLGELSHMQSDTGSKDRTGGATEPSVQRERETASERRGDFSQVTDTWDVVEQETANRTVNRNGLVSSFNL